MRRLTPTTLQAEAITPVANRAPALQRQCACGKHTLGGTTCPTCRKQSLTGAHNHLAPAVQMKSKSKQAQDPREREADHMADRVITNSPEQRAPQPSEARDHREDNAAPGPAAARSSMNALAGTGELLPQAARQFFEPRFGYDFSGVRIHTDSKAAQSASEMNARAYTLGNHVVFGEGQYAPASAVGERLLAHELAHVVQQNGGAAPCLQRAPLTYDSTAYPISPPKKPFSLDDARDLVERKKKGTPPQLNSASIKGAAPGSDEEIFLWYIAAWMGRADRWGTHVDRVAPIGWPAKASDPAPVGKVTVTIDETGNLTAELLSAGASVVASALTTPEEELIATYGIAAVKEGDRKWGDGELNKVVSAFALLPVSDREALKGVTLMRVSTMDEGKTAGEFTSPQSVEGTTVTNDATITLTNNAFPDDPTNFVGDKTNASLFTYRTIVHEVGHAVAAKALRDVRLPHLEAIAKSNELRGVAQIAADSLSTAIGEYKTLSSQNRDLSDKYDGARETKDSGKIAAAKKDFDDMYKEVEAKKAELNSLKKDFDTKNAAFEAQKAIVATKKKAESEARIPATALEPFKMTAETHQRAVAAGIGAAQAAAPKYDSQAAADSEAYRKAMSDAATAIEAYQKLTTGYKLNLDSEEAKVQAALNARATKRKGLRAASAANPALKDFAPVEGAQDAWFEAARAYVHASYRTLRVQNFFEFVNRNNIVPVTPYAKENWPLKPGEFYAEAYSLWRTDPSYLKAKSKLLFDWFEEGKYK
jgi:hypothetical protein